jgi:hypothetical protein
MSGANRCWSSDKGEMDWIETYDVSAGLSGTVSPSALNSNELGTIQRLISRGRNHIDSGNTMCSRWKWCREGTHEARIFQ